MQVSATVAEMSCDKGTLRCYSLAFWIGFVGYITDAPPLVSSNRQAPSGEFAVLQLQPGTKGH
jgi:hypothetical protein